MSDKRSDAAIPTGTSALTLQVLSAGAAAAVVKAVQERFELRSGCTLQASFSAVVEMRDKLLAGAPCDLLILTMPMLQELVVAGHIRAGSLRSLGRVRTGVAVKAGCPHPPIGDADALAAALRAAAEIFHPDPHKATAGVHFMNVLKALGLEQELAPALRPFPNGATAMAGLAAAPGTALIGCTQETEINYTPGVELVGSLPAGFELVTDYALGLCSRAQQPALAQGLADLLTGEASKQARRRGGFVFDE